MRPWDLIDQDFVPDDDGTLYLMKRGSEYAIHVDGRELMTNKMHGSEAALADLACDRLDVLHDAHVLVGGLGMGFTLRYALDRIGPMGTVTVAELLPAVVRWNREVVGKASGHPLRDPRSHVYVGDVGDLIEKPGHLWSTILLDVDNGPNHLTRPNNGWLYTEHALELAKKALIPGGILGVWSAAPDDTFTERMREAGFDTEEVTFYEENRPTVDDRGEHTLWFGRNP